MNNTRLIASFLNDMWNEKNHIEEMHQIFSSNVIINSPIKKRIGRSAILEIDKIWLNAFPDMRLSNIEILNYKNTIVAQWVSNARHEGKFNNLPTSGRKVCYQGTTVFIFEKRKITNYFCQLDLGDIYKQLGYYFTEEKYPHQHKIHEDKRLLFRHIAELCAAEGALSAREMEAMCFYLHGHTMKLIGKVMQISPRTAEDHIQQGFSKLDCNSKCDLIGLMKEKRMLAMWQDLYNILLKEYH